MKQYKPNEVIFSIHSTSLSERDIIEIKQITGEDVDNSILDAEIHICPREYFEQYKDDTMDESGLGEINDLLVKNGFDPFIENIYTCSFGEGEELKTLEDVKNKVISLGLHHSQDLQDFIENGYSDSPLVDDEDEEGEDFWDQFTTEQRAAYEKIIEVFALWWDEMKKKFGNFQFDYNLTDEENKTVLDSITKEEMIECWDEELQFISVYSWQGNLYVIINGCYDCDFYSLPKPMEEKLIEVLSKYTVDNLPPLEKS